MSYPSYLIHFNKNHSKVNGQFTSGDGDGDGIANDHANQKKKLLDWKYSTKTKEDAAKTKEVGKKQIASGAGIAAAGAATMFVSHVIGKTTNSSALEAAAYAGEYFIGPSVLGYGTVRIVGGAINTGRANKTLKNS